VSQALVMASSDGGLHDTPAVSMPATMNVPTIDGCFTGTNREKGAA
jgi:hypothetical protein